MTVADLRQTAKALADGAEVLIYLDLPAEIERINDQTIAGVEGYFTAGADTQEDALILVAGKRTG